MDIVTKDRRSQMMAGIKGKNTRPEMIVRRLTHDLGYRFRLHRKDLPGSPDMVFPRLKLALFVHGCFWHRHKNCQCCYTPKTNVEFWSRKLENNVLRDKRSREGLEEMGWRVAIIWECETANAVELREHLRTILSS